MVQTFKKVSIACLFLLVVNLKSSATSPTPTLLTDSTFLTAYDALTRLNIEEARNFLKNSKTTHQFYLNSLVHCIDAYFKDTPSSYSDFDISVKKALGFYSDHPDDPYSSYYEAYIYLLESFVAVRQGQEIKAALLLRRSHLTLKRHEQAHPELLENQKLRGILNLMLGSVPDNYKWMTHLFGMKGSIKTGLTQLKNYQNSHQYDANEAGQLLMLAEVFILNKESSASSITDDTPMSLFLNIIRFKKTGNAETAIKYYHQLRDKPLPPLIMYTIAECYLQQGRYKEAITSYTTFLNSYSGSAFKKDALYKLSIAYYINGDMFRKEEFRQRCLHEGSTVTEADKYAQNAAEDKDYIHPQLIKIRYHTDGGALQQAWSESSSLILSELSAEELLEFQYRKARLLHKMERLEQAIASYKLVIFQQVDNHYYAPNACLQLAYIFNERSDFHRTRAYLNQLEEYKNYPYQRSITNKAQALLNQLPD